MAVLAEKSLMHDPQIKVGGRNLLVNTAFTNRYEQTTGWDTTKNGTTLATSWGGFSPGVANASTCNHANLYDFNGEWVYRFKSEGEGWLGISQSISVSDKVYKIKPGDVLTFSCEVYRVSGNNYPTGGLYHALKGSTSMGFQSGGNTSIGIIGTMKTGEWVKLTKTITVHSNFNTDYRCSWFVYGHDGGQGEFYLRHPMLEKSNTASNWVPAPEDEETERTKIINLISDTSENLSTQIEQTKDHLQLMASKVYTKDDAGRTALEQVIAAYNSKINMTPESIELSVNNKIKTALNNPNAKLQEISTYLKLDDVGVWIGKTNNASNVRMLLEPTSMSFVAGTNRNNPLAKFTTNGMEVSKGTFAAGLNLGNFGFIVNNNGSLTFKKVK